MKFRITLQSERSNQVIPLNYQYELSSWMYRIFAQSDEAFSHFLHTDGYQTGTKKFKLFTFSNLYGFRYRIVDRYFKMESRQLRLDLSFQLESAAEKFIMGLFQNQHLTLGNQIAQAQLQVSHIEALPQEPIPTETVTLRTYSPLAVSKPRFNETTQKLEKVYLAPTDAEYEYYFLQNLTEKFASLPESVQQQLAPNGLGNTPMQLEILPYRIRKKAIHIKVHTSAHNTVKGYEFTFRLTAPIPLIELGLNAGFGTQNSMGFGYCKVWHEQNGSKHHLNS